MLRKEAAPENMYENDQLETAAFGYELPKALIAQQPLPQRDDSRLLILRRGDGSLEHRMIRQLPHFLKTGDLLVMNDSRVFPARLFGQKKDGGRPVELLLLRPRENELWEVLCRPGKRARPGMVITFGEGELEAEVLAVTRTGERIVSFRGEKPLSDCLYSLGHVPLPPYIKQKLHDGERYQTVYARHEGSVAAPTAGLHFTERLFAALKQRGVDWTFITLHVGLGTFRPIKTKYVVQHHMHSEYFCVSSTTANKLNKTKEKGGRLIAVGTTCCRVLETLSNADGRIRSGEGETELFIYPGYRFKAVDALITNFHLPYSTLLMLVSAFAGRDETLRAYNVAVRERYRFYSFGDAMLVL